MAISIATVYIPELIHPGYYFDDDVRHYFMPAFHDIGNRVASGELPLISLRTWYSGNYIGEGQFNLLNPLQLGLYALIAQFSDLNFGALLYAGSHLIAQAAVLFLIGRLLGLPPMLCLLGSTTMLSSGFVSYWLAPSWWNGLAANTWIFCAAYGWVRFHFRQNGIWIAILATASAAGSGWTHGFVALMLLVAALQFAEIRQGGAKLNRRIMFSVVGLALSALISLPMVIPLAQFVADSERITNGIVNNGELVTTLDNALAFSFPSFLAPWPLYFGNRAAQPHYYLSWFILPVWLLSTTRLRRIPPKDQHVILVLLGLATMLTLLSLGPEQFGPLRWPFRYTFYAHICLLFATLLVAKSTFDRTTSNKWTALLAIWILTTFVCWQQAPAEFAVHLLLATIALLGSIAFWRRSNITTAAILAIVVNVTIFSLTHLMWATNDNVGHWSTPKIASLSTHRVLTGGNTLVVQNNSDTQENSWKDIPSGNIVMWTNQNSINGYSPIQHKGLRQLLCMNGWSRIECPAAIQNLFSKDQMTNASHATLMRLEQFSIANSDRNQRQYAEIIGKNGFALVKKTDFAQIWKRQYPLALNVGTISWVDQSINIRLISASPEHEEFYLLNSSPETSRVIWARAWHKGYVTTLNGQRLDTEPYLGVYVSAMMPQGANGKLTLQYIPSGWQWSIPLAMVALLITALLSLSQERLLSPAPSAA